MKVFLYIMLLVFSTNLLAQDNSYENDRHYELTTIDQLKILDDSATFVTDNGTTIQIVDNVWRNYFSKPNSEFDKEKIRFIFYNKRNEFLSFGVVYNTSMVLDGKVYSSIKVEPRQKDYVEVLINFCPTAFRLYTSHPNFDNLYRILLEVEKSQNDPETPIKKALVGAGWKSHFIIYDIEMIQNKKQ